MAIDLGNGQFSQRVIREILVVIVIVCDGGEKILEVKYLGRVRIQTARQDSLSFISRIMRLFLLGFEYPAQESLTLLLPITGLAWFLELPTDVFCDSAFKSLSGVLIVRVLAESVEMGS